MYSWILKVNVSRVIPACHIYFWYKFLFLRKKTKKSTKNLSKTCHWKLFFVIWSYSTWVFRHARHVGTWACKAPEHLRDGCTWALKNARQVGTWARKHTKHVDTWARKHARHDDTWARSTLTREYVRYAI